MNNQNTSITNIDSLGDVLNAEDISNVLGIGYVKSLKLIKYGGIPHIRIGNTYRVSKTNFLTWLNQETSRVINL